MNVLLTGATGFIGSFIWRRLVDEGNEVLCTVRPGSHIPETMKSVQAVLGDDNYVQTLRQAAPEIDAVVHAAASIDQQPFERSLVNTNCLGTMQLLEYARDSQARAFVYISGAPVIGKPLTSPILESHPVYPTSTYLASKLFGELLLGIVDESDLACCSLRVPAPIGPEMPQARILSTFIRRALQGKPLRLAGKGLRKQNYVDVRDIAEAVAQCLKHLPRGVFHVAGTEPISNRDLAQLCIQQLSSTSKIEYIDIADPADDESWDLSISAAKEAFGYDPKFSITDSKRSIADDDR